MMAFLHDICKNRMKTQRIECRKEINLKIRHVVFFAAFIMMNLMVVGIVQAGEWNVTFNVPLTATGLDSVVVKAEVGCSIKDQNGVQLGFNYVQVPITGGAYSGPPVVVPVNAKGNTNPTQWHCQVLRLYDVNNVYCMPGVNSTYTFCNIKAGAQNGVPYTIDSVTGKF